MNKPIFLIKNNCSLKFSITRKVLKEAIATQQVKTQKNTTALEYI